MDNDFTVWFSKSFGLFYLIALSIVIVAYAFWPSNKSGSTRQRNRYSGTKTSRTGISHMGSVMAVEERDPHSGYMTTGHEWNGIKELNTPVPRPVDFSLIASALFFVVYWVSSGMAARGDLHQGPARHRSATTLSENLAQATLNATPGPSASRLKAQADPGRSALDGKRAANRSHAVRRQCAPCHGSNAQGGNVFPNLTTASWPRAAIPKASPRRSASASIHPTAKPELGNHGVRPDDRYREEGRGRQRRELRVQPFSSRCCERCARGKSRPARPFSPLIASPAMATTPRAKLISVDPT